MRDYNKLKLFRLNKQYYIDYYGKDNDYKLFEFHKQDTIEDFNSGTNNFKLIWDEKQRKKQVKAGNAKKKKEKITTSLKNLAKFIVQDAVNDYDPEDQLYLLTDTQKIIKKARKVNVGDSKKGKELKDLILDNIQLEQGGGLKGSSEDQFKKEKITELLVNDNEIYRLAFEVLNGRKATEEEKLSHDYRAEANKKFKEKQAKK